MSGEGTWYDPRDGQTLTHAAVMADIAKGRVALLGEFHDRYDIHRWQMHMCAAALALREKIAVGFEMFPRRVQPVLDEWVAGELSEAAFLEKVEWATVWGFDADLYWPLFHFCRQFKVPMLALNCYRALVTRVGREGWDAIPEGERDGLTPARPASPAHRQHLSTLTGGGPPAVRGKSADAPEWDRFVRAQQTWDRAFACNIAYYLEAHPDALVLGIIGRGHMEYGFGTPDQLDDLGIDGVSVLLTSDIPTVEPAKDAMPPLANAVFRLPNR